MTVPTLGDLAEDLRSCMDVLVGFHSLSAKTTPKEKIAMALDTMNVVQLALEEHVEHELSFARERDALMWDHSVCRGCGVDNTTDWQGYHNAGCPLDAALKAVRE